MIVLQGINDMIHDPRTKDPALFAAGYREFVARLHAKGIKVIGATITPIKGWSGYDEQLETTRQGINEFVRTSGVFDAVVDFDKAIQDPADPLKIKPEFDAGDHLHPSDAGNAALAAAVDLGTL
ncbi:GDSL-type esterase/lipase family protein [Kibdelosporangium aridum]|uniref:GDSL-type esterase/lipase family protein n=1 Tax=Kibdelosporangium aridum TaxID=2030 RepID=UPI00163D25E6|nr:GDSL-type esterase/lipase family protein [Kibdelosporangium aridum]